MAFKGFKMTTAADVRVQLCDALELDLVGPSERLGLHDEVLRQPPSLWYLTGFLVPVLAADSQKEDQDADDETDELNDSKGTDDAAAPENAAARKARFPSSIGMSVLLSSKSNEITATVSWGDYLAFDPEEGPGRLWRRNGYVELIQIPLTFEDRWKTEVGVPNSRGLSILVSLRRVPKSDVEGGIPADTFSVSLFLVNNRKPGTDDAPDEQFAFQACLEVRSKTPFVPRPNLHSLGKEDWDICVADLQYRDACEFAVGHNVSTQAILDDSQCYQIKTHFLPTAEVERVAAAAMPDVSLSMDLLSKLPDGKVAQDNLSALVSNYRNWIEHQQKNLPPVSPHRKEIAEQLLHRAGVAANRIEEGIAQLADPQALEAFKIANRAMAAAARRRLRINEPQWRPFQLAFLLMNLPGIVNPAHPDRETVDLLFFPTGGGKTEAYLGLAAFTLLFRRMKNPGISSAGLTVLMRYTLRLLTLDQLGRAAALICALELEREKDVEKLGIWPFEIGLWVGQAATPNVMGKKGDNNPNSARSKTIAFQNDDRKPSPIPLEECPWCGEKFKRESFKLVSNPDHPLDLRVTCLDRECDFNARAGRSLPILGVDEPIYRRLPCFMIATIDKFAAMPWTGEVGAFFGRVDRFDQNGFYGPCSPGQGQALPAGRLPPPDLIIQDELHLISGPLGTVAGLYETALDALSTRVINGKKIVPKVIASTATVRRARSQIQALFCRPTVDIFPPPGPDRRDSFFAQTIPVTKENARQYVGVAAPGRSPKKILLRTYLALMAAAFKQYQLHKKEMPNPADPYMTLLGYFNSLRELGGTRRIVEDEVTNSLAAYGMRKRENEEEGLFLNRRIAYEVLELTSRVSTDQVSAAKNRLQSHFYDKDKTKPVDVALATNMISVGLDITRLGLMVVFGQPKTCSEYIQSTSRVGRDPELPGLVVTIFNLNRPRDRSHYERFTAFHESFYRAVEATSVTPFSPRALDRALAGTLIALARQGYEAFTPPRGASEILNHRAILDEVVDTIANRAAEHRSFKSSAEANALRTKVRQQCMDLLDEWARIVSDYKESSIATQYQTEIGGAKQLLYPFLDAQLQSLPARHRKFRANRSMRDVEPEVNLWMRRLDNVEVEEDND